MPCGIDFSSSSCGSSSNGSRANNGSGNNSIVVVVVISNFRVVSILHTDNRIKLFRKFILLIR